MCVVCQVAPVTEEQDMFGLPTVTGLAYHGCKGCLSIFGHVLCKLGIISHSVLHRNDGRRRNIFRVLHINNFR